MAAGRAAVMAVAVLLCALDRAAAAGSAAEFVKLGDAALAKAEFGVAADHYREAAALEPKKYVYNFKLATAQLALGKTRSAIKSLDKVIAIKPDFTQARSRRAELLLKAGRFDPALGDYQALGDAEAMAKIEQAKAHLAEGDRLVAANDPATAVLHYSKTIEDAPNMADLRMKRGKAYAAAGQTGQAIGDVMRATKLKSDNTDGYFLLSQLHFKTGARADALTTIRECLKLDADHKECHKLYKMLKKFNKLMDKVDDTFVKKRFAESLKNMEKAQEVESTERYYVDELKTKKCQCLTNLKRSTEALEACNDAIAYNEKSEQAWIHKAKVQEQLGDFEQSVNDWQSAAKLNEESREIKDGLTRAQKLLKNSLKRDYYKILGVPRNANKRQITKAYRKMAMEWHPDKFETEEDKKKAEVKFMDIAAAKEVLTDSNKRQMFDNGEDPLDAEEQRERQSGGFHQGFNPFGGGGGGGGGFRFKFQRG